MKWKLVDAAWGEVKCDMAAVLCGTGKPLFAGLPPTVARRIKDYEKKIKDGAVNGEWFEHDGGPGGCGLYLDAVANVKGFAEGETVKTLAHRAAEFAARHGLKCVAFMLNSKAGAGAAAGVLEALLIGDYRFDKYLSKKKPRKEIEALLVVGAGEAVRLRPEARRREQIVEAMNFARDLINEPGSKVTPETLAREARAIARRGGLRCSVLDEKQLKAQGYNGLLTVGAGATTPPRLITMEYWPARLRKGPKDRSAKRGDSKTAPHLCLIGKGITFDTGGISLKDPGGMWEMKGDMSGAATVIATMKLVAAFKPSFRVTGIAPVCCNAIGAKATLPGEIFIAKNGKSIHVDSTDAEGRLILTDALGRAGELKPTHIVDFATLTGSVVVALGASITGFFCNDAGLRDRLMAASEKTGEALWELPLWNEYMKYLKWDIADLNNCHNAKSRNAGAILGGLFLREFVPKGAAWAHLDIAGTNMTESARAGWKYFRSGATGVGVRLMCEMMQGMETD